MVDGFTASLIIAAHCVNEVIRAAERLADTARAATRAATERLRILPDLIARRRSTE